MLKGSWLFYLITNYHIVFVLVLDDHDSYMPVSLKASCGDFDQ